MKRTNENNPIFKSNLLKKTIFVLVFALILNALVGITAGEGVCVTSEPADVRYYLDGVYAGNTKSDTDCITDFLSPMKMHTIKFEKAGYESFTTEQFVGQGIYRVHHKMRLLPTTLPTPTSALTRVDGYLKIYCPLNDVNIFLNGNKIRNSNTNESFRTNDLKPGTYLIEAKKTGYFDWSKSIIVTIGQETTVTIDLIKQKCLVWLNSYPDNIDVFIDGVQLGKTPFLYEGPQGIHKMEIKAPLAFEDYESQFDVKPETKAFNISLTPSAQKIIIEAENLIQKNARFNPTVAETELTKAKLLLAEKDYVPAFEAANNASKWAKDVDGDGVPNDWDFFPNVSNDYIYEIPLIIGLIVGIVILIDRYLCKIKSELNVQIFQDTYEKRKFLLIVSIKIDKKYKSMTCSISLDENTIEILDSPGEHQIEIGTLKRGSHEIKAELSVIQKRYGKLQLNKSKEIFVD